MAKSTIKNLDGLLEKYIGSNKKIVDVVETSLVAPGENYGSYLMRLDLTLKNEDNNEEEELHLVAKLIPDNQMAQDIFNIQITVKKEIYFYEVMVPTLQQFQRENGVQNVIDCFPKFYGGRLNLHGNDEKVDSDSVILLENLYTAGYKNIDRQQGYDLQCTEMILNDLAGLHAIPLAIKMKDPEKFEKVVKSMCIDAFRLPPRPEDDENENSPEKELLEILYDCDKCLPYISKLKNKFRQKPNGPDAPVGPGTSRVVIEPWATFFHADMWVNNQMIKFKDGKPVASLIIDFQMYCYASAASDLCFFLFTSVQQSALENNFDKLVKYYHGCLIKYLQDLGCDVVPFSLQKFLEQFDLVVKKELFSSLMFMCLIAFAKKGGNSGMPTISSKEMPLHCKEKIWFIVQECGKRNWI
ncbi:hypothetical protein JTB14_016833 [Gonioctena quinquepunctata]|nr:hypothetical protein JTB14_016833 [Gonioctena quinquepunctata]